MRRALAVLFTAAAVSGCVSTGYYRDRGAADYYYERGGGYAGHASYSYYGGGWGYSPYYSYGGFYPFYGYGYYGYPSFGFNSGYGGSWYYPGYDYYDSVWWHHQQAQVRQREREHRVRSENAAIAAMPRAAGPSRDGAMAGPSRAGRFGAPPEAGRSAGPEARPWRNADESRQVRTGTVDPYYGAPRPRRGVDAPERGMAPPGGREALPRGGAMPQRSAGGSMMPAAPVRQDRAPAPLFRGERVPAPIRSSEPAFDRAPSFNSPRMAPSVSPPPRSGDGGRIRER